MFSVENFLDFALTVRQKKINEKKMACQAHNIIHLMTHVNRGQSQTPVAKRGRNL